ncbi:putative NBD/HSP70 family sugar kinase [Nakamurella sp. UYEF19]|uniref:ROK family transcriptional regulator n=1 Tax=Nakamurella sp. UYEF19 TaxID=1756392 RepID=UPI0033926B1C
MVNTRSPGGDSKAVSSTTLGGAARAVAREILIHGPRSRTELALRLEMSQGSLTRLTKSLIDRGLLVEGPANRGVMQGRPSMPLDIVADAHLFVGVKLTGDAVFAVLANLRADIVDSRQRTLDDRSPAAVCAVIAELVAELTVDGRSAEAIGVGFGGHAPDRRSVFAPYLGWDDTPLASMLERAVDLPCVVDNDVVCLTEAQHWFGAGRGHDRFAVVTMGAGIGYALVVHDRIVRSLEADIGVLGHYQIDPTGPLCPAGHRGCAASYLEAASICAAVSVGLRRPVTYDDVLDLAQADNPVARIVIDEAGMALGRLLAAIADLALCYRVILSGEGVRLAVVAEKALQMGLQESRPTWANPVVVDIQEMGFSQWARGAAVIAIQTFLLGPD